MRHQISIAAFLLTTTAALAHEQGDIAMGMIGGIGHLLIEHTALILVLPLFAGILTVDRWRARRARTGNRQHSRQQPSPPATSSGRLSAHPTRRHDT